MAAVLRNYPNGMGGYIRCFSAPLSTRDANEWLKRVCGKSEGLKISSKNNGKVQELKYFGKVVLRVSIKDSTSIIPICQMTAQKYNLLIDWYNPVDWRTQFKCPSDIAIVSFDE